MAWVVKIAFCNKQFFILYMKCLIQLLMTLVVEGLVHDMIYCHAILQSWAFTLILWWSSDYFWFCCIFCTSYAVCMYIHAPHLMLWWLFDDKFSTSRCFFLYSVLLLNICFIEVSYIIVESCKSLGLTFICVCFSGSRDLDPNAYAGQHYPDDGEYSGTCAPLDCC